MTGQGLAADGGGGMGDRIGGIEYRVRRTDKTSLVLWALMMVGIGAATAARPSGPGLLAGGAILVNLLCWFYLLGPAAVVTVWPDALEVTNVVFRYVIPRACIVAIEPRGGLDVWVRVEPDRLISVSALTYWWSKYFVHADRVAERAGQLAAVLAAHSAVDDHRGVTRRLRWANVLAPCLCIIMLLLPLYLMRNELGSS